jgi:hypothetical protein
VLLREVGSGDPNGGRLMGAFVLCTIVMVVMQVVSAVVIALLNPKSYDAPADERERMIDLKASRIAFVTLSIMAMGSVLAIPLLAHGGPLLFPRDPIGGTLSVIGGNVFFAVVVAELVHAGGQIFFFRRAG